MASTATPRSFIRYPGSKAKLVKHIIDAMPERMKFPLFQQKWQQEAPTMYVEPFVGAGAIMSAVIAKLPHRISIVLNDIDWWMACLWKAVKEEPQALCEKIDAFEPTSDAFYRFKKQDGAMIDPTEAAFRKLALHQISFSGLGAKAGGPLGGRTQNNPKYSPSCRWRPASLKKAIKLLNRKLRCFRDVKVFGRDFAYVLNQTPGSAFVYLDPPYYKQGPNLYKHSFTDEDHSRLASLLRVAKFDWLLSYDDHRRIRELYSWAHSEPVEITYTTATARDGRRPKNGELLIRP